VDDQVYETLGPGRKGPLVRHQRLLAHELRADTPDNKTHAVGPGTATVFQRGSADGALIPGQPGTRPAPPKGRADGKQEMTLTKVDFQDQMWSKQEPNSPARETHFYGNVEVYHLPAETPDVQLSADSLPKGGMYLTCHYLKIRGRPQPDGTTKQYMEGTARVSFRTPEFYGRCSTVKYDEAQDEVIFLGAPEAPATLYRRKRQGGEYEEIKGKKILYNRKTGEFILDGGRTISISQAAPAPRSLAVARLDADRQDEAVAGQAVGQEQGGDLRRAAARQRGHAEGGGDDPRRYLRAGVAARHDG
jgi:hypothetical protein